MPPLAWQRSRLGIHGLLCLPLTLLKSCYDTTKCSCRAESFSNLTVFIRKLVQLELVRNLQSLAIKSSINGHTYGKMYQGLGLMSQTEASAAKAIAATAEDWNNFMKKVSDSALSALPPNQIGHIVIMRAVNAEFQGKALLKHMNDYSRLHSYSPRKYPICWTCGWSFEALFISCHLEDSLWYKKRNRNLKCCDINCVEHCCGWKAWNTE